MAKAKHRLNAALLSACCFRCSATCARCGLSGRDATGLLLLLHVLNKLCILALYDATFWIAASASISLTSWCALQVQDRLMQHLHSLLTRILQVAPQAMPPGQP